MLKNSSQLCHYQVFKLFMKQICSNGFFLQHLNQLSPSCILHFISISAHQIARMDPPVMYSTNIQFVNKRLYRHASKYFMAPLYQYSVLHCFYECLWCRYFTLANCQCRSFNIFRKEGSYICELNNAAHEDYPLDFISQDGSQYYMVEKD